MRANRLGVQSKKQTKELPQLFDVVGITDDLFRSTCLMSISLEQKIPPRCNCSLGGAPGRRLNPKDPTHGVLHHGSTFQTTPQQTKWIEALTQLDLSLYDFGKHMLIKQVETIENQFKFTMCLE